MNRQIAGFFCSIVLGIVVLPAPIRAQVKAWNPTCAQVLALGFERYANEHEKRSNDYSTAGNVQRSARYIECKNADNARHLQVLAPMRRARVQQAEKHLGELENALWSLMMMANGNGTIHISSAAYSNGIRSDVLGKFITATQRAKRSVQTRNEANAQWSVAAAAWKNWDKLVAEDFASRPELKDARAEYTIVRSIAQRELGALQTLAAKLPDEAALILARRCATNLTQFKEIGF